MYEYLVLLCMRLYLVCIYEYVNLHTKRKANEISWHDLYFFFLFFDVRFEILDSSIHKLYGNFEKF